METWIHKGRIGVLPLSAALLCTCLWSIMNGHVLVAATSGVMALFGFGASAWLWYRTRFPRLLLTKQEVQETYRALYERVRTRGGRLTATHVVPLDVEEPSDQSKVSLAQVTKRLIWKRLIFMEDSQMEHTWIEELLSVQNENLERNILYVPSNLLFPSVVWQVIPRFNLLLYCDGSYFFSMIGLGTLPQMGRETEKTSPNLGIVMRGPAAYGVLERYFGELCNEGGVTVRVSSASDPVQYPPPPADEELQPHVQAALARIYRLAADPRSGILHVGVFGSLARRMLSIGNGERGEPDVDLMVFAEQGREREVRESLAGEVGRWSPVKMLGEQQHWRLVWGDDQDYFYDHRDRPTIDIELHEQGTEFYQNHRLLGHSIFRYYRPIYSAAGQTLTQLAAVPLPGLVRRERWEALVNGRKGLRELRDGLQKYGAAVDSRRVLALALRGIAWAEVGDFPPSAVAALNILRPWWLDRHQIDVEVLTQLLNAPDRAEVVTLRDKAVQLINVLMVAAEASVA